MGVERHKAAIRRTELSRPVRLALADNLIRNDATVFDFGCGHGDDVRLLTDRGITANGWDPMLRPNTTKSAARVVNLGYVLNVIEDVAERVSVLREAWELAQHVLVVSARTPNDARSLLGDAYADGVLTRLNTFQKLFDQAELLTLLEHTLQSAPVAAAPGVFYVFKDAAEREAFAATRVRRGPSAFRVQTAVKRYAQHEDILRPLVAFLAERGRLPVDEELTNLPAVVGAFRSVRSAGRVVRAALGEEAWEEAEMMRAEDLLVYLALARFHRRPTWSQLPRDLRYDVRAFFRTHTRACALADEILMRVGDRSLIERACRSSRIGKLTPSALYVHTSALPSIPPLLRVYEGCARAYIGNIEGANIIKLHRNEATISYLGYPRFERDAHPALSFAVVVHLATQRFDQRSYASSNNPPILHRKECFVGSNHPRHTLFARLTRQEEAAGLFRNPDQIGTLDGWNAALSRLSREIKGHRLTRRVT